MQGMDHLFVSIVHLVFIVKGCSHSEGPISSLRKQ